MSAVLDFIYDANGKPFALNYSTDGTGFTTYYYVLNLQGDVIKLITASGSTVATYSYDAWGKVLSATGTMAEINPLRYRGYYYDTETGFYYLQSRYYDLELHRFINADSLASTGQGFLGTNMFAYCLNNPANYVDETGDAAEQTIEINSALGAIAAWLSAIGSSNAWNIVGWIAFGLVVTVVVVDIGVSAYDYQQERKKIIEDADAKIRAKVKKNSKDRYWTATLRDGYVDIGRALTFDEAVAEVVAGRNVFAVTASEAMKVAIVASGSSIDKGKVPRDYHGNRPNEPGFYMHYHTYNRKGGHVFFLFSV